MKVDQPQESVFRVNCLDNLDRSNVVQSLFARRMIAMQFRDLEWDEKVNTTFDDKFESIYKNIWADNADAMSMQVCLTHVLLDIFKIFCTCSKWHTVGFIEEKYISSFDVKYECNLKKSENFIILYSRLKIGVVWWLLPEVFFEVENYNTIGNTAHKKIG